MSRADTTAFCFGCEKRQPFRVYVGQTNVEERGRQLVYHEYTARCAVCGGKVDVEWVDDLNYKSKVEARDMYDRRRGKKSDGC